MHKSQSGALSWIYPQPQSMGTDCMAKAQGSCHTGTACQMYTKQLFRTKANMQLFKASACWVCQTLQY